MNDPLRISIITPSLNQGKFIERTIRSVLQQQVAIPGGGDVPVEYIVVDGGSSDRTLEILSRYSGRITWISEPDKGQSDAINKGIAMASGDIIGYLNSDDVYLPGTLQKVAEAFHAFPESAWLYGMARMIDDQDAETRKWISCYKRRRSVPFSSNRLLTENYISQPAVFFTKEAFVSLDGFDRELHYAMDYDLWLRLAQISTPLVLKEDLAAFRVQKDSKSSRNYKQLFHEQYKIHLRYDQNKWRLFRHRVNIAVIQFVYGFL